MKTSKSSHNKNIFKNLQKIVDNYLFVCYSISVNRYKDLLKGANMTIEDLEIIFERQYEWTVDAFADLFWTTFSRGGFDG